MEMENKEELFTPSNHHHHHRHHTQIVKRKRTKRQRTSPPSTTTAAATSTTSSGGAGVSGDGSGTFEDPTGDFYFSTPSATTSGDISCEDEDVANCLILLAQSCSEKSNPPITGEYECRTCNRNFPTFQALGGHRASHKKAKWPAPPVINDQNQHNQLEDKYIKVTAPISSKVHECSICGSQFTSGQALGGHMRRHRAPATTPVTINGADSSSGEYQRSALELDLNLPPVPEEDRRELEFPFTPNNPQQLVFSATALVGCNY